MLWLFLGFLVLVSGFVAYAGDEVGRRVGRKHIRLFGLRPKTSALIVAIGAGMLISLLSLGGFAVINRSAVRTVLEADRVREELADLKAQIQPMQQEIAAVRAELASASAQRDAARQQAQESARQRTQALADRDASRQQVLELRAEAARLAEETRRLEAETAQLNAQTAGLSEDVRELRATRDALQARAAQFEARTERAQQRARAAEAQRERAENTARALEARSSRLQEQLASLEAARDELEARNARLNQELRREKRELEALRVQLVPLQDQARRLQNQQVRLQRENSRLQADNQGLFDQGRMLKAESGRLQAQNDRLRADIAKLQGEFERLEDEARRLRLDYVRQSNELAAQRTGQYIVLRGDLVHQAVLEPTVGEAGLARVLREAQSRAYARGARGNPSAVLPAEQQQALLRRLETMQGAALLTLRSATNQVQGYPLTLEARLVPNTTVYPKAQPIRTRNITLGGALPKTSNEIREQIDELVESAVVALEALGVPAENIRDGGLSAADTFELINRLRTLRGTVSIGILSRNEVRPGDTIELYPLVLR
ncbi:uncharacterized protein (DUF3084 family) [Deinobacterium chartae]|uniref:Uncharacterized protein (DUF3084 family) n=1 Tax=Deinobacterium chartae TaxID=521158 RepID=A0A841HYE2_9DEIO|nr:DUF3084 domain-containing protein [Deinobacterium chartae]MBB6096805.1 uncharacterized protein (DUF3084 family) [Deinobacterium chartae]